MAEKRKNDADPPTRTRKRVRLSTATPTAAPSAPQPAAAPINPPKSTRVESKRVKLAPPRPFPTVPTSVSATGPRSAHKEGKNMICISRKTTLGAYLRRCKNVIMKDGYTTLHLSGMGAAIPHLMKLALALPPILPFAATDVTTEYTTSTVQVQDELVPEDEDEDLTYETRGKSCVLVVITISSPMLDSKKGSSQKGKGKASSGGKAAAPAEAQAAQGGPEDDPMEVV